MKKNVSFFLIVTYLFLSINLFAQEKWSNGPEKVGMVGIGKPSSPVFIMPNYINPNTTPRIINSPSGINAVSPNIRVHPNNTNYQSEIYICRNPINQLIMFGASNSYTVGQSSSFLYSTGYYITTNGGVNWYGNDTLNSSYGDPGPFIDKNGNMVMTYLANPAGMGSSTSTNNGLSWNSQVMINSSSADKNLANADDNASSPYYGRGYVVWSFWTGTPYIVCSYTTNSGGSWNGPYSLVAPTSGSYQQGCDVVTYGPAGTVYVTWACPTSGGSYTETYFGFGKSSNGGVNWSAVDHAFPGNGIRGNLTNKNNLRVNSFPRIDVDKSGGPREGWIYITTSQKNLAPAGSDADIICRSSSDGGTTWSAAVKVNQDPLNNGKTQWFPAVKVDGSGGVNIVYYDDRNCLADSAEIYMSRSVDGGLTWSDMLISDARQKIVPISESGIASYYGGDYIGITVANNKIWPMWMDRRTGLWQAFTASIDLGPSISHTSLGNTEQTTGTRAVNCVITPAGSPIVTSLTKLFVAKNAGAFDSVQMTNSSGTNWTANITLSGPATYKYYIRTVDNLNRIAFAPAGAPGNFYSFQAMPDTVKPVIAHTPLLDCPKLAWPSTVTASVTDNIGVDSVWVNWKKGANGTSKRFRLLFTSGNSYSAAFNSTQPEVNYNDTIFYRVIAQDISSNHNRDSSSQYHFKILSQTTACLGTGTIAMGSASGPFNTYWYGNRTNLLYTSAEILANYGAAGSITKIGFQISVVGGQAMNGLNIKMQNTTLTALTGFTSTGWTTVYSGTYTVPGTGWQYIELTTPYVWNGTSNLLVEICFGNTSYTTATTVLGTTMTGMENTEYHDLSTACSYTGFTTPVAQTARANTCFVINTLVGVNNNNTSTIPEIYSLSQNYPNPFNPVTQIKYGIPKQGLVTMKIYDVLGREITKLVNEVKTPGSYIVDFDGTNLSSGVYFYKLEVNGFNDVKRMMLIK